MKRYILLVVAFAVQVNFAQNTFPAVGNVGIGTLTPASSLSIRTTPGENDAHIFFGEHSAISGEPSAKLCFGGTGLLNSGFTWVPDYNISNGKLYLSFGGYENGMKNSIKMTFQSNGNVGIGTTVPNEKLHILGNIKFAVNQSANDAGYYGFLESFHASNTGILSFVGAGGAGKVIGAETYGTDTAIYSDATEKIRILGNGNVGIGKTNPINKLDVNGTIHSKEVKVDMTGWSDFVFKKEYNLPTLEEVEKHIVEKGHLENIPSEKEIIENGVNLGEMNAKLLQKIEELTLYVIEMKKENYLMKKNQEILGKRIIDIERK